MESEREREVVRNDCFSILNKVEVKVHYTYRIRNILIV